MYECQVLKKFFMGTGYRFCKLIVNRSYHSAVFCLCPLVSKYKPLYHVIYNTLFYVGSYFLQNKNTQADLATTPNPLLHFQCLKCYGKCVLIGAFVTFVSKKPTCLDYCTICETSWFYIFSLSVTCVFKEA